MSGKQDDHFRGEWPAGYSLAGGPDGGLMRRWHVLPRREREALVWTAAMLLLFTVCQLVFTLRPGVGGWVSMDEVVLAGGESAQSALWSLLLPGAMNGGFFAIIVVSVSLALPKVSAQPAEWVMFSEQTVIGVMGLVQSVVEGVLIAPVSRRSVGVAFDLPTRYVLWMCSSPLLTLSFLGMRNLGDMVHEAAFQGGTPLTGVLSGEKIERAHANAASGAGSRGHALVLSTCVTPALGLLICSEALESQWQVFFAVITFLVWVGTVTEMGRLAMAERGRADAILDAVAPRGPVLASGRAKPYGSDRRLTRLRALLFTAFPFLYSLPPAFWVLVRIFPLSPEADIAVFGVVNLLIKIIWLAACAAATQTALRDRVHRMQMTVANSQATIKSAFLRYMAEELRTPLHSMRLGVDALSRRGGSDQALLRRLNVAASTMDHLLTDVLTLEAAQTGRLELQPMQCALLSHLKDAAAGMQARAEARDVTLIWHQSPDRDVEPVIADFTHLSRALSNLISNAIKFSDDGGTVSVWCQQTREGPHQAKLRVDVVDSGPGISASERGTVFLPFTAVERNAVAGSPGVGLGLPVTRMIVEDLHGGRVGCKGRGRRAPGAHFWFRVRLPFASHAEAPAGPPQRSPRPMQEGNGTQASPAGVEDTAPPDDTGSRPLVDAAQHQASHPAQPVSSSAATSASASASASGSTTAPAQAAASGTPGGTGAATQQQQQKQAPSTTAPVVPELVLPTGNASFGTGAGTTPAKQPPPKQAESSQDDPVPTILLADTSLPTRHLLSQVLEGRGASCVSAESAHAALSVLGEQRALGGVHLVLASVTGEDWTPVTFAEAVRSIPGCEKQALPLYVLADEAPSDAEEDAMFAAGVDVALQRPLAPDQIALLLSVALRAARRAAKLPPVDCSVPSLRVPPDFGRALRSGDPGAAPPELSQSGDGESTSAMAQDPNTRRHTLPLAQGQRREVASGVVAVQHVPTSSYGHSVTTRGQART